MDVDNSFLHRALYRLVARTRNAPMLHNWAIQLYSCAYPLPFQEAKMEFTYGTWGGISSIRCVNGRQLGETNTQPVAFRRIVPTQFHQGHLNGSREAYRINLTALQHMMRLWPDLLDFFSFIRSHFIVSLGIKSDKLTVLELYLLALTCVSVPAFLVRRSHEPIADGHITSIIADQQKLITGVFMIVRHMLEKGYPLLNENTFLSGEELYAYADQEGLFLSPDGNKTACGGSKRKIIELLNFLINIEPEVKDIRHESTLKSIELIGPMNPFLQYAFSTIALELGLFLGKIHLKQILAIGPLKSTLVDHNLSNALENVKFIDSIRHKKTLEYLLGRLGENQLTQKLNMGYAEPQQMENCLIYECIHQISDYANYWQASCLKALGKTMISPITLNETNSRLGVVCNVEWNRVAKKCREWNCAAQT